MSNGIYHTTNLSKNQQKWLNHYKRLCDRGQHRFSTISEAKENLGYVEVHHVHPICLGGSDDISNLTFLTAEEHFIAHKLLTKVFINHKGIHAACFRMASKNNKIYGWLKKRFSKATTILTKSEISKVIQLKNSGMTFGQIHKLLTEQGIKISYSTLPSLYKRTTGVDAKSNMKIDQNIINFVIKERNEFGRSFRDIEKLLNFKFSYSKIKSIYHNAIKELGLDYKKVDKKNCNGTLIHKEKMKGRSKETHQYLKLMGEKIKQNNKFNNQKILEKSLKQTILPPTVLTELVLRRETGQSYKEIYNWILSLGYKIAFNTVRGTYNRINNQ